MTVKTENYEKMLAVHLQNEAICNLERNLRDKKGKWLP